MLRLEAAESVQFPAGVEYTRTYSLPGGTISIADQALTIVNSNFLNLNASAPASLVLSGVNATIQTANFTGNLQAAAGESTCLDG